MMHGQKFVLAVKFGRKVACGPQKKPLGFGGNSGSC